MPAACSQLQLCCLGCKTACTPVKAPPPVALAAASCCTRSPHGASGAHSCCSTGWTWRNSRSASWLRYDASAETGMLDLVRYARLGNAAEPAQLLSCWRFDPAILHLAGCSDTSSDCRLPEAILSMSEMCVGVCHRADMQVTGGCHSHITSAGTDALQNVACRAAGGRTAKQTSLPLLSAEADNESVPCRRLPGSGQNETTQQYEEPKRAVEKLCAYVLAGTASLCLLALASHLQLS